MLVIKHYLTTVNYAGYRTLLDRYKLLVIEHYLTKVQAVGYRTLLD